MRFLEVVNNFKILNRQMALFKVILFHNGAEFWCVNPMRADFVIYGDRWQYI